MKTPLILLLTMILVGCATPSRDVYNAQEAGQAVAIEFGTILDSRPVTIQGEETGLGGAAGGIVGGLAGSSISGGDAVGAAAGALVGLVLGTMAERDGQKKPGTEYTIATQHGRVITVAQFDAPQEAILRPGQEVMVQTRGSYHRVLPAEHMPPVVSRPHGVAVIN